VRIGRSLELIADCSDPLSTTEEAHIYRVDYKHFRVRMRVVRLMGDRSPSRIINERDEVRGGLLLKTFS
jgi:hypothetical protein